MTPSVNILKFLSTPGHRFLFVYAHPDDEILCSGGFIQTCISRQIPISILVLTCGEQGIHKINQSRSELSVIRRKEFFSVMDRLKIKNRSILDFPDGRLADKLDSISETVGSICQNGNFTTIVTHDKYGGNGHPDHIATSIACKTAANLNRLQLLWSVDLTSKINPRDMQMYFLKLSPEMQQQKIGCLSQYESQVNQSGFSGIFTALKFINQEYYLTVNPQSKIFFRFKDFKCLGYKYNATNRPITI